MNLPVSFLSEPVWNLIPWDKFGHANEKMREEILYFVLDFSSMSQSAGGYGDNNGYNYSELYPLVNIGIVRTVQSF